MIRKSLHKIKTYQKFLQWEGKEQDSPFSFCVFWSKAEGLEKLKKKKFFVLLLSPEVVLNYID